MTPDDQSDDVASATAGEVLRVIFGPDLRGCAANVDDVVAVIRAALVQHAGTAPEVVALQTKAFEAVQLLSTPPADGMSLSPEDLRSLLGDRLDKIRNLATQVLNATKAASEAQQPGAADPDASSDL
jgi:hypothetical protein